jgi:hypothetical protein
MQAIIATSPPQTNRNCQYTRQKQRKAEDIDWSSFEMVPSRY